MSLKGGNSPSTLAVPVRGRDSRLAAKERAAAKERSADQRRVKAEMAAAREGRRRRPRTAPGQQADKGSGRGTPTPTNLESNDSEPAAVRPAQLGVCALFGSSCSEQGRSGSAAPSPAREAGSSKGGDKRSVDCKLGTGHHPTVAGHWR